MGNELNRLRAVRRFKQLDETIANDLNELVKLAAQLCNTPVALITLLDEDTQWFKASIGIDIDCTDRKDAFCNYTIQQDGLLIVPDAREDERFADNPFVCGEPHIRFYAGATLITKDGYALGSLCVIDMEARTLNEQQQYSLTVLARQAMNLMELSWSLASLEKQYQETQKQKKFIEESEIKLNAMFNSSKDTHVLVNRDLEIMAFNNAAVAFTEQETGKILASEVSILEYTDPRLVEAMTRHFETAFAGKSVKIEWHMHAGSKNARWKELEFLPIRNNNNEIIGVALNSSDVTDRKLKEEKISIQNAALTRIAIIQSHEIRRPVASLMGIMALIKMEQGETVVPEYFHLLDRTVKELDEKIREIVQDSENTINDHLSIVA